MKLEKYISDLLYRYDLVIVPGFGGIVARRKPAHFNHDTYVFSPPHKELSFNAQLQENDGLLADYVAGVEGVSYDEALEKIAACVADWKKTLKIQKRIRLDQIGIFNLIDEDKIVFLPLTTRNYLAEAYGLTSFIHRPIRKNIDDQKPVEKPVVTTEIPEPKEEKKDKVIKKSHTPRPVYKTTVSSTSSSGWWKAAAVVFLALGLGAGVALMKNNQQAPVETYQKATFVLQKDFPVIQLGDKSKGNKNFSTLNNTAENNFASKKYFIISGAFRNKNNAERKTNELKASGYKAEIIGKNKRGLWMVAYEGFASKEEANKKLINIKQKQSSAWIFTKK